MASNGGVCGVRGRLRLSNGEGACHGEGAFRLGALEVSVAGDGH